MKIICTKSNAFSQALFAQCGDVAIIADEDLTPTSLADADVLITRTQKPINAELLQGSAIKFIGTTTSGSDHIDKAYLAKQQIQFADARGSNALSVAQYVITALVYWAKQRECQLCELTIALIGYGYVGKLVAQYLQALNVNLMIYDPLLFAVGDLPEHQSLPAICQQADVISLHACLTRHGEHCTQGLINADIFAAMQRKPLLINTARGELIESVALMSAVLTGQISDMIFDVWPNEPAIAPQLLANTFLASPHIAGHSYLAKQRGAYQVYLALCNFLNQEPRRCLRNEGTRKQIDARQSSFVDILLQACPLDRVNATMHSWLKTPNEIASHFKQFRKEYAEHQEFSQITVSHVSDIHLRNLLKKLGFNIDESNK